MPIIVDQINELSNNIDLRKQDVNEKMIDALKMAYKISCKEDFELEKLGQPTKDLSD